MRTWPLVSILVAGTFLTARAHEMRPAYLELREAGTDTFEVLWKVPARGDLRLALHLRLPESCAAITPVNSYHANEVFIERYTVACRGGLTGQSIFIDGLSATLTDVLVRFERADGTTQVTRLTPAAPSFVIAATPSFMELAGAYTKLGIEHILVGIDHLLFVLALLLMVEGWRRLVKTITAFTVAHSLTLALATLGFVHVPPRPVDAVIALSIIFLAAEVLRLQHGERFLTARYPWVVAFGFGLLHGLGFAGALTNLGLPRNDIPAALVFFNVGVEIGQVAFITAVLALLASFRVLEVKWPRWSARAVPYAIGSFAASWFIARLLVLLRGGA
ncbi:MAG: HupE/UreJ family protein [bacterium]